MARDVVLCTDSRLSRQEIDRDRATGIHDRYHTAIHEPAKTPMPQFQPEDVQRYYDGNTRWMLRLGQGGEGTIHRAVWGPGVRDRRAAMAFVDELIIERLRRLEAPAGGALRIVDLGSGVGASLCRIARALPVLATGVTISHRQAELARRRIQTLGLSDSVRCVQGDFCDLPPGIGPADAAFGIESFVHARDPEAFFHECQRLIRPGGYLILCDDFLGPAPADSARARRWVARFEQGWLLGSLAAPAQVNARAQDAGFSLEETLDLTSCLELGRPRDWWIALMARGFGWLPIRSPYWSMLRGGDALQVCLKRGWVQHLFMVWRRGG
jgi:SAM-dependent methyltransferase